MEENIKIELINLLSVLFKDKGFNVDLIEYTDLISDLAMDSLTFISMVVELEAHFNIEVPDDLLLIEKFKNVDDIIKILEYGISLKANEAEVSQNV